MIGKRFTLIKWKCNSYVFEIVCKQILRRISTLLSKSYYVGFLDRYLKTFFRYKRLICKHDCVTMHPEFLVATFKLHNFEYQKDLHLAIKQI